VIEMVWRERTKVGVDIGIPPRPPLFLGGRGVIRAIPYIRRRK